MKLFFVIYFLVLLRFSSAFVYPVHCKCPVPKIWNKIPEMKLYGLVPNFYIHVSVSDLYIPTIGPQTQYSEKKRTHRGNILFTDAWMQKLGTRPHNFISENICLEFSVQCEAWMCDSEASFLLVHYCPIIKICRNQPPLKIRNTKVTFPTSIFITLCSQSHLEISRLEQMFWTRFTSELEVAQRGSSCQQNTICKNTEPEISVN